MKIKRIITDYFNTNITQILSNICPGLCFKTRYEIL